MVKKSITRRDALRQIVVGAGITQLGLIAPAVFAESKDQGGLNAILGGLNPTCAYIGITEDGPLYPAEEISWLADLASPLSGEGTANGEIMYLFGRIFDAQCNPLSGASVEIWQADATGHYRHPRASSRNQLDPNFQYFGKVRTALDGSYLFRSIVPHWYNMFGGDRAAHVHIKMRHPKHGVLTTEMYFAGNEEDSIRKRDRVFESRFEQIKSRIVVPKEPPSNYKHLRIDMEKNAICCNYDLAFLM